MVRNLVVRSKLHLNKKCKVVQQMHFQNHTGNEVTSTWSYWTHSLWAGYSLLLLGNPWITSISFFFFFLRFYLFIQRRRQGEKETSWFGCLSHAPYWGPGLQPRHVPWLGIKPATPLVCRLALNPLSLTSQGSISLLVELGKGFNSSSVVGRDFRVGLYDCPKMVHNTVCILGFGGQPEV